MARLLTPHLTFVRLLPLILCCAFGCSSVNYIPELTDETPPTAVATTGATIPSSATPGAKVEVIPLEPAPRPGERSRNPANVTTGTFGPGGSATRDDSEFAPKFHVRGRVETDVILVNQSERNKAILGDLQNAVGFRRARLGAEGTLARDSLFWVSEFDFAGGTIGFRDVFVGAEHLPVIRRLTIGHFREPFGLEGQPSSNDMTFNERSPIDALNPGRNWGVGIANYTDGERATFAAGAFRTGTNSTGQAIGDGDDMAYTFRLTGLPWYDDVSEGRFLVHLGGTFSQRFPKDSVVTFSQATQNNLLNVDDNPLSPFVANIVIPARQNQLYNLQWATVLGSASFQAEWSATSIDQIGGGPVFLWGAYASASYFLTGEYRAYDRKAGRFTYIQVHRPFVTSSGPERFAGPGAWELAARLAYQDFSNTNIPRDSNGNQVGDQLSLLTLGVNWYLNDNARIMFNYNHAIPVNPTLGPSSADGFFTRFAIYW